MILNLSVLDKDGSALVVDNIAVDVQNFPTTSSASPTLTDNSTATIIITLSGYHTYTNTIRVYQNDETISIKLIQDITDTLDAEYRRPHPWFFIIIEPCTYNVHIYDGQSIPFGELSYEENGVEFSSGQRNFIFDTCIPDIISLDQRIIVRTVSNCGGSSPILFDVRFSDVAPENGSPLSVTTTEFKPEFQLDNEFNCCVPIDELITVFPEVLNMNSVAPHITCDITTDPTIDLSYSILSPSQTITALETYDAATIDTGPLSALTGTFTPDELGTYILTVSVTNCCTTVTRTYNINICESWQITNTECNKIVITNLSSQFTLTYSVKELTDNDIFELMTVEAILQEDIVIQPLGTVELDLVIDNIYTVTLITNAPGDTEQERVFVLDCNIKKCKKEFLLSVNCPPKACDELQRIELYKDFAHFKSLEEILYYRWDEWVRQQSVFPSFSINDIIEDVLSIRDVMNDLDKLCIICGIKEEDCDC